VAKVVQILVPLIQSLNYYENFGCSKLGCAANVVPLFSEIILVPLIQSMSCCKIFGRGKLGCVVVYLAKYGSTQVAHKLHVNCREGENRIQ
jgi:hypothetical protein